MNYGRKGLQSRRRKLSSHGDKLERAFGTNLLRILLFSCTAIVLLFQQISRIPLFVPVFSKIVDYSVFYLDSFHICLF